MGYYDNGGSVTGSSECMVGTPDNNAVGTGGDSLDAVLNSHPCRLRHMSPYTAKDAGWSVKPSSLTG